MHAYTSKDLEFAGKENLIKQESCECTLNLKYNSTLSGHPMLIGLKHSNQQVPFLYFLPTVFIFLRAEGDEGMCLSWQGDGAH